MSLTGVRTVAASSQGLRRYWLAFTLLVAGLIAATLVTWAIVRANRALLDARLDALSTRVAEQLVDRVGRYEYAVRGARGAAIAAGPNLTRDVFARYATSRDIAAEFPGLHGFGIVLRVPAHEQAEFERRAQAEGAAGFKIRQIVANDRERWVIRYIEPLARNAPAVGLDVASEKHRFDAARAAMLSGHATLTAPVSLVQAKGPGFLLFLPIYRSGSPVVTQAQREAATVGWAYAPLAGDQVLATFKRPGQDYDLTLSDASGTEAKPFFASSNSAGSAELSRGGLVRVFGREWHYRLTARPQFVQALRLRSPWLYGAVAFLIALIPAGIAAARADRAMRARSAQINKARLAAIVEGSNDAIIGFTLDGVVTDWNPAAERLFGVDMAGAIGRPVSDLIVPPDLKSEERNLLADLRYGEPLPNLVTRRSRAGGEVFPVRLSMSVIRDAKGSIIGAASTVRDISEQVAAQEQISRLNVNLERQVAERTTDLVKAFALQSAILAHAGYAVIATDPDGTITLFNPAAEDMLGYDAEELIGKATPGTFHDPEEVAERAKALSEEFGEVIEPGFEVFVFKTKRGLPNVDRWTYVTKDRRKLPVELNVSPLRTQDGVDIGFLGIAVDLREQDLREAELEQARHDAEKAAAAKAEFLAVMSHELRTPLNSVIGFSRLMIDGGELTSPTLQRQAQLIHDSSRTLLSVVNDVLDLSRIEAGRVDLDPRPFDIIELADATIEMLRAAAAEKHLELRFEPTAVNVPPLLGDDSRLRQVLLNLLSNAIKFTVTGHVTLKLDLQGSGADRRVRFEVVDTGIGIARAKRHRVFARFSQADSSTSREFGGSGLGLSISKSLIEMMGGSIGFESEEGKGSTFWFEVVLPTADALAQPSVSAERIPKNQSGLRILLAEDVAINQELAVAFLSQWGHEVDVVGDGAAAVEAVQSRAYDVVLMDVQMPIMDGVEATRRIRAGSDAVAQVPIVAMTANVLAHDLDRFREAGMSGHVGKPFDPVLLHEAIEQFRPPTADCRAEPLDSAEQPAGEELPSGMHARFDQKCAEIYPLLRELRELPHNAETFTSIAALAHQIAGLAGMFGQPRLGDLAAEAEEAARAAAHHASDGSPTVALSAIDRLILAVRSYLLKR